MGVFQSAMHAWAYEGEERLGLIMVTTDYTNPFEYEAASKLPREQVLDYYIEDFNYSRFIRSRRNIFLVGERGTGKTMALRYYSLPIQNMKAKREKDEQNLSIVSVYVPCNTPLTHRREYELLDGFNAMVSSEHLLVISIMDAVVEAVSQIDQVVTSKTQEQLLSEIRYVLNLELPKEFSLFQALQIALNKSSSSVQDALNSRTEKPELSAPLSFSSGLRPLLTCLSHLPALSGSHFSLMIDDAHLLNPHQMRALNSWIAYRENTLFSFKVATTKVDFPSLETASGGSILEGHDFTKLDMEQPYQDRLSDFGKLARQIVARRLRTIDVKSTPDEYFPVHPSFKKDMAEAESDAEKGSRLNQSFEYLSGL